MRKLALLLAAALVVSAPMLTTSSTDSYAAAKAKKAAKKAVPEQETGGLYRAFTEQLYPRAQITPTRKAKTRVARKKKKSE